MYSNFQNSTSNSKYSNYLSNCDLINKYNLNSVHNIPKLKKITLELEMKNFLNSYEVIGKDQTDSLAQTKAFLSIYALTGKIPYIKAEKSVAAFGRQKSSVLNYSLKTVLNKKVEKNNFLFSMFVENWQKLKLEDFKLFNSKSNKNFSSKKFVLNSLVPGYCLFEIDEILSKSISGINSKNIKLRVNFSFDNNSLLKNRNDIILNLPFFWISGRVV